MEHNCPFWHPPALQKNRHGLQFPVLCAADPGDTSRGRPANGRHDICRLRFFPSEYITVVSNDVDTR